MRTCWRPPAAAEAATERLELRTLPSSLSSRTRAAKLVRMTYSARATESSAAVDPPLSFKLTSKPPDDQVESTSSLWMRRLCRRWSALAIAVMVANFLRIE